MTIIRRVATVGVGVLLAAGVGAALTVSPPRRSVRVVTAGSDRVVAPAAIEVAAVAVESADVAVSVPAASPAPPVTVAPKPALVISSPKVATVAVPAVVPTPSAGVTGPDDQVWVRDSAGYCVGTDAVSLAPGLVADPACPGGQPAPGAPASTDPSVWIFNGSTGVCFVTGPAEAVQQGAAAGSTECDQHTGALLTRP